MTGITGFQVLLSGHMRWQRAKMNKPRLHLGNCTTCKTYIQYVKKSLYRNHRSISFLGRDLRILQNNEL